MSAHTPGPWVVVERTYEHYLGEHVERLIATGWDHPQMQGPLTIVAPAIGIGEVKGGPCVNFIHISEANARLIAEAPALLEALRELVQLEIDGRTEYESSIESWERARAAIARATGGES